MISRRQIISGSAGPIFAIFSPNESILGADDRSDLSFRELTVTQGKWWRRFQRHDRPTIYVDKMA